jgi:hypothetical protein
VIDFDDKNPQTHLWQQTAFERVAQNKQRLFDKAVKEKYDYVWICDTDLLLDRTTLWSMYHANQSIVAAVYWTRWQANSEVPCGPQVWLRHPYDLAGRGMDAPAFRSLLVDRQFVRVWGLGACMLVKAEVLTKARYWPLLPELVEAAKQPGMGMLAGEDRTFCVMAERNHIEMYADAWPDIFHVYRPDDEQDINGILEEFTAADRYHALYPAYGDAVSLQVVPLEDPHFGPAIVRGRVGQLKLLPELEAAVLSMQRGDRRLLRLAFPIHYELPAVGQPQTPPWQIQGCRSPDDRPQAARVRACAQR